ncbi:cupin domain-containing protein [Roseobacter sinensis]|uniref:Cupin domain-containing protein n=1 Tax=Roseobacter sinensis TaxID=2931391 RepID=A0ABT3BGR0_9RHOB|nr:cupin domain-containing protein [Roseobacter sp. WL0113]MCV3272294.1 cupin domain-containing protein [Roseobacter sp. WL0113]
MPKVIVNDLPTYDGPDAAAAFAGPLGDYIGRAISKHHGLNHLGANIETLMPGASSSHRHWHDRTDELVVVLDGHLVLEDDAGSTDLGAGDVAVFPAGDPNGHCITNRSNAPATFLVVGTRDAEDRCFYADIDLVLHPDGRLTHRDGEDPAQGNR